MRSEISREKVVVTNGFGEKLVGVLHGTGCKDLVILCHGFRSTKEDRPILCLLGELVREGISAFHFDFSGNGESEGLFQFGNYWKEANDLRSVVLYLSSRKYIIKAVIGHSKGGNVALLYASMYGDIRLIVNISGRFALERGIESRLGKGFMERIMRDGFVDVKDRRGKVVYRVNEESLTDRMNTDMRAACNSISKECRVLTVHGSADETVPVEDAYEFAKYISNHRLQIIQNANHNYVSHQADLASAVLEFLKSANKFSCNEGDKNMSKL